MREALRVILFQFLSYGLQLLFMLPAAKELGPDQQGMYALLRTSAYLIEAFMWFGLTSGSAYFVARNFERYHDALVVSSMAYLSCGIALGLPVVVFVLPQFDVPVATGLIVYVWVISLALVQFLLRIFLGQQRYLLYNMVNILINATLFALFIVFAVTDSITLHNVIYCNVISNMVGLVAAVVAHRRYLRRLKVSIVALREVLPEFYSVGLRGYFSSVVFLTLFRVDLFFVGYFHPQSLGFYSLAIFVIEAVQKVPDWLAMVLSPKVSAGLDADGAMTRTFARNALIFVLAIGAVLGVLDLVHFDYLQFVLGPKYEGVEIIVLALIPKAAIHTLVAVYGGRLAGRGYALYHPLSGVVALVTLVVVDSILLPPFGLTGAIVGISIAYAIAAAIMVFGAHRVSSTPFLHHAGT